MTGNSSLPPGAPFTLGAYSDPGPWRWLYFVLVLCVFALIVASNLLLVAVIALKPRLHQPMFVFLCSLFVNELLGSGALFPFLLFQLLQDEHRVPHGACFLQIFCIYLYASVSLFTLVSPQIFCIYLYASVALFTLAAMALDRYLAICRPLQYHSLMTQRQVALLLALAWLVPAAAILALVSLSASLRLCGSVIPKLYCGNYAVVKLACSSTRVHNVFGLLYGAVALVCPLVLILYTYGRIFAVCLRGTKRTRRKALATCAPHLASVLSFAFGCVSQVVMSRFDVRRLPGALQAFLSLYFITCQPLFTPLIYGLNMAELRRRVRGLLTFNPAP